MAKRGGFLTAKFTIKIIKLAEKFQAKKRSLKSLPGALIRHSEIGIDGANGRIRRVESVSRVIKFPLSS